LGPERFKERRSDQIKRGMWRFLGDALMKKLKHDYEEHGNIYEKVIRTAEEDIVDEKISGHEAAMKIMGAIFRNDKINK
jgi:hypothetical protein